MNSKGANHAGTAASNTLLDHYGEDIDLTIYDRNDNISFLGCRMTLWIGRQINDYKGLFYSDKEALESKGATVHMETEVTSLDTEKKKSL